MGLENPIIISMTLSGGFMYHGAIAESSTVVVPWRYLTVAVNHGGAVFHVEMAVEG